MNEKITLDNEGLSNNYDKIDLVDVLDFISMDIINNYHIYTDVHESNTLDYLEKRVKTEQQTEELVEMATTVLADLLDSGHLDMCLRDSLKRKENINRLMTICERIVGVNPCKSV
jgi:hypothetical protein